MFVFICSCVCFVFVELMFVLVLSVLMLFVLFELVWGFYVFMYMCDPIMQLWRLDWCRRNEMPL